ncbi:MAG: polyprenyl synthetase family protein [Alphaproteobacteria bacterium]
MTQTALAFAEQSTAPSLDSLYTLIAGDLKAVDAFILQRIQSDVALINDIAMHIVASGGKRIRPALTLISAHACGDAQGKRAVVLATAIEFIHTATLLHDDVVDESTLRRGLATANDVFGNKASVLVGDFLLSQAFQMIVGDNSMRSMQILADASAIIAKGEVMQLMTEGNPETTFNAYIQVIESKTAALFAAACELGAVAADQEAYAAPLREFGQMVGTAFQLMDDVLDYSANQKTLGKTIGDDFREGKVTLPVILAYHAGDEEEQAFWNRCIADGNQKKKDFDTALSYLKKHGALERSMQTVQEYCQKALLALANLPESPAKTAMGQLAAFCARREY